MIKNLFPVRTTIDRLKYTSLSILSKSLTDRSYIDDIRIRRMNLYRSDLSSIFQTDKFPGSSLVFGFKDPLSGDHIRAKSIRTRAYVNNFRLLLINGNCSNGRCRKISIRDILPSDPIIFRFPDSPTSCTHVKIRRLSIHPFHCSYSASTEWADISELVGIEDLTEVLRKDKGGTG